MFDLFETFLTLYETKSFTTTSNYLFVTQSTVTKRLQKLEAELNTVLFCRNNIKDISPTPEADKFYPTALQFVKTWKKTQDDFVNHSIKTTVKIGVSQSSAKLILPKLVNLIKEDLKYYNFKIRIYDSKKIFSLVETHQIHLGIIDQDFSNPKVTKIPLFKDKLVLAGNIDTNIFFLREIKFQLGYYMKKFLKEPVFNFEHVITINDNDTILSHVKQGIGASLLPLKMMTDEMTYQELPSEYLLHYSIVHYSLESNTQLKELINKIKNNIDFLSSE